MFQALERSWKLIKGSFKLIAANPTLFVFPVLSFLSFIAFLFLIGIFAFPALFLASEEQIAANLQGIIFFGFFLLLFASPFFGTFFAVALSYETGEVLKGQKVSISRGIKHSIKNLKEIILWALTLFLINILQMILRRLAEKYGGGLGRVAGNTVIDILLAGWGFVTAFVIPIMAFEDTTPFASMKKSFHLLKATWGETLVGYIGAGSVLSLLLIPLFLLLFVPVIGIIIIPILILAVIFISLLTQVFNTVFMTALYLYATEKDAKKAEKYFDKDLIEHGFY
ncbi:MAG TPA: hypothetical protein HA360_02780 [Nanoarchaeota archaeon]|nr:hypothetical protein [Candidatus Woesearchaeota archaeon]HIH15414.1 hypothetical protein [Nanoarchaeota archaeon]HIH58918.1 hypothetical protein [Nanoarchaeota archaeon]HII13976.1 hypothetical protein [Nanoarchaeota archaeon]HIJ04762.1 hypothetical protein [Nanoarchaeota archaeon]